MNWDHTEKYKGCTIVLEHAEYGSDDIWTYCEIIDSEGTRLKAPRVRASLYRREAVELVRSHIDTLLEFREALSC